MPRRPTSVRKLTRLGNAWVVSIPMHHPLYKYKTVVIRCAKLSILVSPPDAKIEDIYEDLRFLEKKLDLEKRFLDLVSEYLKDYINNNNNESIYKRHKGLSSDIDTVLNYLRLCPTIHSDSVEDWIKNVSDRLYKKLRKKCSKG